MTIPPVVHLAAFGASDKTWPRQRAVVGKTDERKAGFLPLPPRCPATRSTVRLWLAAYVSASSSPVCAPTRVSARWVHRTRTTGRRNLFQSHANEKNYLACVHRFTYFCRLSPLPAGCNMQLRLPFCTGGPDEENWRPPIIVSQVHLPRWRLLRAWGVRQCHNAHGEQQELVPGRVQQKLRFL